MTDIDLATGLPELPEGYHWRVTHPYEEEYYYFFGRVRNTSKYAVELCANEYEEGYVRKVKRTWYCPFERSVPSTRIQPAKTVWTRTLKDEVTAETIREAASIVLSEWTEFERKQKFLGDYPPKKLES